MFDLELLCKYCPSPVEHFSAAGVPTCTYHHIATTWITQDIAAGILPSMACPTCKHNKWYRRLGLIICGGCVPFRLAVAVPSAVSTHAKEPAYRALYKAFNGDQDNTDKWYTPTWRLLYLRGMAAEVPGLAWDSQPREKRDEVSKRFRYVSYAEDGARVQPVTVKGFLDGLTALWAAYQQTLSPDNPQSARLDNPYRAQLIHFYSAMRRPPQSAKRAA